MRILALLPLQFLVTRCYSQEWPYNLPKDVKYFPEDADHVKRELHSQKRLQWQDPLGVKKMSDDESEKFFLQYWYFGEAVGLNSTMPLYPAIAIDQSSKGRPLTRSGLMARDFMCPADTSACSAVGSTLCCPTGQTCVKIKNSVGCCPDGKVCGDTVGKCDTGAGYSECPNEGGCCIPGSQCKESGCVFYGTSTVLTITTATATVAPQTPETTRETTTVTVTTTIGGQASTVTNIIVVNPSPCSSGFQSCPASLGGGCCPNDRDCGTSSSCLSPTSSASASAPLRPTTMTDTITAAAAVPTTSVIESACPTGFYMCSARYLGGCCRVGRDCQTTSCPATASTTLGIGGPTVVVPAATGTSNRGSCPNGWASCAVDAGGGCCPSGYGCGESCTATASGQHNTGKIAPSWATSTDVMWGILGFAVASAMAMVFL